MTREEILAEARQLNDDDRRWLEGRLRISPEKERRLNKEALKVAGILQDIIQETFGVDITTTRTSQGGNYRAMAVQILTDEGFKPRTIGHTLQVNPSSCWRMRKKVEAITSLPRAFKQEMKDYKTIKDKYYGRND